MFLGAGSMSYQHLHKKGDAALRGTASDILLRLWRRRSNADQIGDVTVLSAPRAE